METENQIPDAFSPLDAPMKERSYSKPDTVDTGEIEEPEFKGGLNIDNFDTNEDEVVEEQSSKFDNITNEAVNNLDAKEKSFAVEQMVETCLQLYEMAHGLGQKVAKVDEMDIAEAIKSGEIDPSIQLPVDEKGTTINAPEFFQNYNEEVEEVLTYDQEFGDKVRPAMKRVFTKRGWAMTDENYLAFAFGKDIFTKGILVYSLRKNSSMMMNTFKEITSQKQNAIQNEVVQKVKVDPSQVNGKAPERKETSQVEDEILDEIIVEEEKVVKKKKGRPKKSKVQEDEENKLIL
tara:strand:- start:7521 stop:8393 length:873 start_codon:yes stop_codon:yes gene_type:complete